MKVKPPIKIKFNDTRATVVHASGPCPDCRGKGGNDDCEKCHGKGVIQKLTVRKGRQPKQ
jgi:DnaJ-class molecular chaperone